MRMFNPIQVVELPRQDPMAALRLFSSVGGLRVLVVGGDGTVGWILGCIDRMQVSMSSLVVTCVLYVSSCFPIRPDPLGLLAHRKRRKRKPCKLQRLIWTNP